MGLNQLGEGPLPVCGLGIGCAMCIFVTRRQGKAVAGELAAWWMGSDASINWDHCVGAGHSCRCQRRRAAPAYYASRHTSGVAQLRCVSPTQAAVSEAACKIDECVGVMHAPSRYPKCRSRPGARAVRAAGHGHCQVHGRRGAERDGRIFTTFASAQLRSRRHGATTPASFARRQQAGCWPARRPRRARNG